MIRALAADGKTILVSSHILTELAEMCDRVGIIELGRLIGPIKVEPAETDIKLYTEQGRLEAALLRAVGSEPRASYRGSGAGFAYIRLCVALK